MMTVKKPTNKELLKEIEQLEEWLDKLLLAVARLYTGEIGVGGLHDIANQIRKEIEGEDI